MWLNPSASNPAKLLNRLQREIEEAIISLAGERTRTAQKKKRLEASLTQNEMREADWSDKAKTAMDHGREDLARQALMAREDWLATVIDESVASQLEPALVSQPQPLAVVIPTIVPYSSQIKQPSAKPLEPKAIPKIDLAPIPAEEGG